MEWESRREKSRKCAERHVKRCKEPSRRMFDGAHLVRGSFSNFAESLPDNTSVP